MNEREAWLAARRDFVTASDVAAMMGESPYKTRDQLRMEKAGLADEWTGNEHTDIALHMEQATLELANKRFGWNAQLHKDGLVPDTICARLAATPDATMDSPWSTALVQIKWTSSSAQEDCKPTTKNGKPSTAAYLHGPPIYHQLQVQTELACMGLEHGVLLVMHHGFGLKLRAYYIPRHERVIARIRKECMLFWKEVESCQVL